MDMYAITAEHPLLGILRNVPLEKTIDYADAAGFPEYPEQLLRILWHTEKRTEDSQTESSF